MLYPRKYQVKRPSVHSSLPPDNEACYQRLAKQEQKVKLAFISSDFVSPGVYLKYTLNPAALQQRAAKKDN